MAFALWLLLLVAVAWWARRTGKAVAAWAAGAGWLALPFYNAWVLANCPGDCGIRADLVVALPLLLTLTAVAVVRALWGWHKRRG